MKYLFLVVILLMHIQLVYAQSAVKKDLYKEGRVAFASEDYSVALNRFVAFREYNPEYLERHKQLNQAIASAIKKCEVEIEKARLEEENRRNGIVSIQSHMQVAALIRPPSPIYLLPEENLPRSNDWQCLLYETFGTRPFATITVSCLSNEGDDYKTQSEYVNKRIEKFKLRIGQEGWDLSRITWSVKGYQESITSLEDCMFIDNPPIGSICFDFQVNSESTLYDLD